MTRRLLAALVLVLSLALPVLAAEEITLVVWDWQGFRNDQLKPYAEEYSRLNPHIKFEFQIVPLAQYPDRLTAALAAGVAPDLPIGRLLAALVLVLSLALPVLAAEEITLVVWDWQGFRNDQLKPYAEEYSRLNPHIKFEFQIVPLAQYPDRLTAALAAGVAPDL